MNEAAAALALHPAGAVLTWALRRLGRERPEVFERLGAYRRAEFVVSPTGLPVAFRLRPDGREGSVRVVPRGDRRSRAATISGPLATLIALADGAADADSSFFSRAIEVKGDTEAVVALHNTLEAAELTPGEVLGLPVWARTAADRSIRDLLDRVRRMEARGKRGRRWGR